MTIKYFKIELDSLISLKNYLCGAIESPTVINRQVIRSLTILMCEFDTMSDKGEVVEAIYATLSQSIYDENQLIASSNSCGLIGRLSDLRGVYEGTFRSR